MYSTRCMTIRYLGPFRWAFRGFRVERLTVNPKPGRIQDLQLGNA